MNRFDVWLVMKNPEKGRVVDNLGLCTIVTPDELIAVTKPYSCTNDD